MKATTVNSVRLRLPALLAVVLFHGLAWTAPFTPTDDQEILQAVPARARTASANPPTDVDATARLAQSLIEESRSSGDPRALGQAEALLRRWESNAGMPVRLLVLRATVQQSLHQFAPALETLNAALARDPRNAQALLTRATVLQVRGEYKNAELDCRRLAGAGASVPAQLCLAGIASLTGHAQSAELLLRHVLGGLADEQRSLRLWAYTMLAEAGEREVRADSAERDYRAALVADPRDRYVLAAYCDFLLDQQRPREVLALTNDALNDDNLVLRRALALRQLSDAAAGPLIATLVEHHALAMLRNERTHLREAARLALHLQGEAPRALLLARENWMQQKEPADLRILMESAAAAHDEATLSMASHWMSTSGLQDHRAYAGQKQ